MKSENIQVNKSVYMQVFYSRQDRVWVGTYRDTANGYQMGDSWYDETRDGILVFRPPTPLTAQQVIDQRKARR